MASMRIWRDADSYSREREKLRWTAASNWLRKSARRGVQRMGTLRTWYWLGTTPGTTPVDPEGTPVVVDQRALLNQLPVPVLSWDALKPLRPQAELDGLPVPR